MGLTQLMAKTHVFMTLYDSFGGGKCIVLKNFNPYLSLRRRFFPCSVPEIRPIFCEVSLKGGSLGNTGKPKKENRPDLLVGAILTCLFLTAPAGF